MEKFNLRYYDFEKIGERIREQRKKAGYAIAEKFLDAIKEHGYSVGRNRLLDIEKGCPQGFDLSLNLISAMIDVFREKEDTECEMGYLLCEYDLPTRANTDIHAETGLSDEAINTLKELYRDSKDNPEYAALLKTLNAILEHRTLPLLRNMYEYFFCGDCVVPVKEQNGEWERIEEIPSYTSNNKAKTFLYLSDADDLSKNARVVIDGNFVKNNALMNIQRLLDDISRIIHNEKEH